MGRLKDYSGMTLNGVFVVRRADRASNIPYWECVCVCGRDFQIRRDHLERGSRCSACGPTRSIQSRIANGNNGTGKTRTPEYGVWCHMKARCHNPNLKMYHRYGGRGITVCQEWREDFDAFLAHVGHRPSAAHSIERIDNDKGYEPGNVRWATRVEQQNNRERNRIVTYAGSQMTLSQAIRMAGLRSGTVRNRLHKGWTVERALAEPVRQTG